MWQPRQHQFDSAIRSKWELSIDPDECEDGMVEAFNRKQKGWMAVGSLLTIALSFPWLYINHILMWDVWERLQPGEWGCDHLRLCASRQHQLILQSGPKEKCNIDRKRFIRKNYTKYCIWCHQSYLSCSILIVIRLSSVTPIKCKHNIICHSL